MSTIFQKQNGFLTFIWAAKHLQTQLTGNKEASKVINGTSTFLFRFNLSDLTSTGMKPSKL